jgi:hypothetical protein
VGVRPTGAQVAAIELKARLVNKDEAPTLLLTNYLRRAAPGLIEQYAKRMLIENSISDGVDFFHMDALSSAVALKINCDLQLTLMGSSLYRMLGSRIGGVYATAESRHIFRDFVEASARRHLRQGRAHPLRQTRPQPVPPGGRLRPDRRRGPVVGRPPAHAVLRLSEGRGVKGAH